MDEISEDLWAVLQWDEDFLAIFSDVHAGSRRGGRHVGGRTSVVSVERRHH